MPNFSQLRRGDTARRIRSAVAEAMETRYLFAAVSAVTPYNGQQSVAVASNIEITFASAMNASTLTSANVTLRNGSGALVANALSYNSGTRKLTIDPTANLATGDTYFTVRVAGGSAGVKGSDGSQLTGGGFSFGFSTGKPTVAQTAAITGLTNPSNVEFAADGRVYVAEKSGIIKLFDNLSDTTATQVADLRTGVHNFWDRGLLGMALDPAFTTGRPYLYVLYTADNDLGSSAPKWGTVGGTDDTGGSSPTGTGATVTGKLSRLTIGSNGVALPGSEVVLINDWQQQFPSHSIGDLKFGPDGYLYASAGDGASFNAVDTGNFGNPFNDPANEGGAVRAQDILTDGDPAGLDGSIIRIHPDTGAAAPGNPYASSGDANKRRIIANGLRNPFRMTFRPGTSELWIADTGWNAWEEINRINNATNGSSHNFGWPAYEGNGPQYGYDQANIPLLEQMYATPGLVTNPFFTYKHSDQVVPGSGEPTGGSTPTGIAFYNGDSFPAVYNGAMFWADYGRSRLYVMHKGVDGNLNPASRQVAAVGSYVELQAAANGDLYGVDMAAGRIVKIVPSGYNRAPVAALAANVTSGTTPLAVNFSTAGTADPDGGALTYEFDLDGDGVFTASGNANPSYTYTVSGNVTASVRVTDAGGLSSVASVVISVANRPPVPTINSPLANLKWKVGDTISFGGGATDPEDGNLANAALKWDLILVHGSEDSSTSAHEHRITSYTGVGSGTFIAPDHEYPSWLVLRLTATDSRGLVAVTERRIDPLTVTITFASNVAGTFIGVNDRSLPTPFSRTLIAGSTNSLSAPLTQTTDAANWTFASWSQGGAATQTFVAPASNAAFTVTYTTGATTPAAPTGLTRALTGPTTVELDWTDASNNETGFVIQRRYTNWIWSDIAVVGANVTHYVDGSVFPGTAYEYRVAARNSASVSAWSEGVIADTGQYASTPPAAPSGVAANALSDKRVNLTWTDNASSESNFRIERRLAGGSFALLATVGANVTAYVDATAVASTAYEYRVYATNSSGSSTASNVASVTTPSAGGSPPANPTGLAVTQIGADSVRVNWTDNAVNETGFIVQRRYTGWIWEDLGTVNANVTTFTDNMPYTTCAYEYRVIAINAAGQSDPSNGAEIVIA